MVWFFRRPKKKIHLERSVFFFNSLSLRLSTVCVRRFRLVVLLVSHEWNFYYPKWLTAVHSVNSFCFWISFWSEIECGAGINLQLIPMRQHFHAQIPRSNCTFDGNSHRPFAFVFQISDTSFFSSSFSLFRSVARRHGRLALSIHIRRNMNSFFFSSFSLTLLINVYLCELHT